MADLNTFLHQLQLTHYHSVLGFNGVNSVAELAALTKVDLQVLPIRKRVNC